MQQISKRLADFESINLDDRFNSLTLKMIGDVCREQLTPIQMNTNMELKVLRKLAEEQRSAMEEYRQGLKRCLDLVDELRSTTVYSQ